MSDQANIGPYTVTGATRRQLLQGEQFFLLSEGSDIGTPLLLGDTTPMELGELYE